MIPIIIIVVIILLITGLLMIYGLAVSSSRSRSILDEDEMQEKAMKQVEKHE